ncbi:MAG: S41 family peptidase [Planctomycetota bacterium]
MRNVLSSGEHDILIVVEPERAEGWVHLAFELEEESPHGLSGIRVNGPVDPESSAASNKRLDDDRRERLVNRIADELARGYIFEDVGQAMAEDIRNRLANGEYDAIEYSYPFAQRLTDDLRAICHDKHLRVIPRIPMTRRGERGSRASDLAPRPEENYGFSKVEVLPDNVGYIKLHSFEGSRDARPTAAAAMAFVANTDALIFDVTENGGGSPNMINFLCGYLFDKRVHLNTFHNRAQGAVSHTYSEENVPGKHYGQDKPVYVLTSGYTFSGAEEFTYDLKHLERATVVGETTGGGAHPVTFLTLNKYFILKIPHGRAVNPVTKTNWEGAGVTPHVEVPADKAKENAYRLALDIRGLTEGPAHQPNVIPGEPAR